MDNENVVAIQVKYDEVRMILQLIITSMLIIWFIAWLRDRSLPLGASGQWQTTKQAK